MNATLSIDERPDALDRLQSHLALDRGAAAGWEEG